MNAAIALVADPDVLILDEPTAALDPGQRRRLWAVARGVREAGGAVVFATQDLDEVERFAHRVAVLAEGRIVFDGAVDDYARAPEADVFT